MTRFDFYHLVDGASLAVFRVLFGAVMMFSAARFVANGWVEEVYLAPELQFTYYGFSWVRVLPECGMYGLFAMVGLSALGIALGALYRLSCAVFFVSFTYLELIDKTTYLNHYYLVSILAALMLFMPLHRTWSIDELWFRRTRSESDQSDIEILRSESSGQVPQWCLWCLRLQVGLLYVFAGLAKLQSDWLWRGEPLATWLHANADLPLVGPLLDEPWVAVLASWAGAGFDLFIVPALLWPRTRTVAYAAVVGFHLATAALFPIGVFPWLMIGTATIFLSPSWPRRLLRRLGFQNVEIDDTSLDHTSHRKQSERTNAVTPSRWRRLGKSALALHFALQIALPLRHYLYPGDTCWTEEGYRFAWRVMLIEKTGQVDFHLRDPETGRTWTIHPREFLTPLQTRMMSTQPDMILEFAHRLAERFAEQLGHRPEVRAEAWVSLNGRRSRLLIDPAVDLARQEEGFPPKEWILGKRTLQASRWRRRQFSSDKRDAGLDS